MMRSDAPQEYKLNMDNYKAWNLMHAQPHFCLMYNHEKSFLERNSEGKCKWRHNHSGL